VFVSVCMYRGCVTCDYVWHSLGQNSKNDFVCSESVKKCEDLLKGYLKERERVINLFSNKERGLSIILFEIFK
jgi:hypothetical protein